MNDSRTEEDFYDCGDDVLLYHLGLIHQKYESQAENDTKIEELFRMSSEHSEG